MGAFQNAVNSALGSIQHAAYGIGAHTYLKDINKDVKKNTKNNAALAKAMQNLNEQYKQIEMINGNKSHAFEKYTAVIDGKQETYYKYSTDTDAYGNTIGKFIWEEDFAGNTQLEDAIKRGEFGLASGEDIRAINKAAREGREKREAEMGLEEAYNDWSVEAQENAEQMIIDNTDPNYELQYDRMVEYATSQAGQWQMFLQNQAEQKMAAGMSPEVAKLQTEILNPGLAKNTMADAVESAAQEALDPEAEKKRQYEAKLEEFAQKDLENKIRNRARGKAASEAVPRRLKIAGAPFYNNGRSDKENYNKMMATMEEFFPLNLGRSKNYGRDLFKQYEKYGVSEKELLDLGLKRETIEPEVSYHREINITKKVVDYYKNSRIKEEQKLGQIASELLQGHLRDSTIDIDTDSGHEEEARNAEFCATIINLLEEKDYNGLKEMYDASGYNQDAEFEHWYNNLSEEERAKFDEEFEKDSKIK